MRRTASEYKRVRVTVDLYSVLSWLISKGMTRVIPRLLDTTGCQTSCQTGLTTGLMFVYTIQPVVKRVVQPVWQPVWQPVRIVYTNSHRFDNRLYRVNGALARDHTALPATHTFIHTCLYSPAAQRHRALAGTHFPCRRVPRQTYCYLPGRKALPMGFCCGFFDGLELPSGPLLFIWFQHWRNYTITENVSVGTLL